MKIVAMMKSNESFKRLKYQLDNAIIEWEELINDLDDIREKIPFIRYDMAIVDDNLWWKDEAIELLNKYNVEVFIFEGDFEKIAKLISDKLPKSNEIIHEDVNQREDEKEDLTIPIRYIEKEVIREKEVKIKVPVYTEIYTNIPKKLIIIGNLSKRAGSTFLTLNLAKALSELKILVNVIEPPLEKPYIFDTYGLEMRLNKTDKEESLNFYSYQHEINNNNKIERDKETIEDGIIWTVPDSRKPLITSWDYYKMMKLLYISKKANISILDVGNNLEHEVITPLLDEADKIFIVIDPMPAEIMQNHELLDKLISYKDKGMPIEFVINRWTSGVKKKDLLNFMKINPIAFIPDIDTSLIHKSVYNCDIPYSLNEVKEKLEMPLNNMIKMFVPSEYLKSETEKNNNSILKHKLFKKLRKE